MNDLPSIQQIFEQAKQPATPQELLEAAVAEGKAAVEAAKQQREDKVEWARARLMRKRTLHKAVAKAVALGNAEFYLKRTFWDCFWGNVTQDILMEAVNRIPGFNAGLSSYREMGETFYRIVVRWRS